VDLSGREVTFEEIDEAALRNSDVRKR